MKSEVEINKYQIQTGDVLHYIDASNSQRWKVLEVDPSGFEAIDQDGHEEYFLFADCQIGWSISEKTKAHHELYRTASYV